MASETKFVLSLNAKPRQKLTVYATRITNVCYLMEMPTF